MSTVVRMRNTSDHAAACGRADGHAREWRLEKLLDHVRLTGSPIRPVSSLRIGLGTLVGTLALP
jgi:hypothetical protein